MRITQDDISREKAKGNANNDWVSGRITLHTRVRPARSGASHTHASPHRHQVLTQRLVVAAGVANATLEAVTAKFEELYQGTATTPGLYLKERLIVPKVRRNPMRGGGRDVIQGHREGKES